MAVVSTYPLRSLTKVLGVDADGLVGLAAPSTDSFNTFPFEADPGDDIGTDLNAYMVDVSDAGGGVVLLKPGIFDTSVPIFIPQEVKLRGSGKRVTTIRAMNTFPIDSVVITLGRVADGTVFDCGIEDIEIDCAQRAGSIGVYSNLANEGCGCHRAIIKNYKDTGIFYDANAEHFDNTDLEVINPNQSNNYGIKLIGGGWPSDGVHEVSFNRLTVVGADNVGTSIAGIYLENCSVFMSNVHLEYSTDGIIVAGDNVSGVINTLDCLGGLRGVHFTGGSSPLVIIGMYLTFITPNGIVDDLTGTAITAGFIPIWSRKDVCNPTNITEVTTSPYFPSETDKVIACNRPGNSVGLGLPTASEWTGRVIRVVNWQPQVVQSVSTDIVPMSGGAAGSDILPAAIGNYVVMQSDGTNWVIIGTNVQSASGSSYTFQSIPGATYAVVDSDNAISATGSGLTLTLPTPADFPGRQLWIRDVFGGGVDSDANNIGSLTGGAGTGILSAGVAGSWILLESDGSTRWQVLSQSPDTSVLAGFQSISDPTYTILSTDTTISATGTGLAITLPAVADFPGRKIWVRTVGAFAVTSASSNIGSLTGGLGSGILPATAGRWAILQSDGTSYWQIISQGDAS